MYAYFDFAETLKNSPSRVSKITLDHQSITYYCIYTVISAVCVYLCH